MPAMNEASQPGKRQEILDAIFNRDPGKTPVLSILRAGKKPEQMLNTWLAQKYPDVASTGTLDGAAATGANRTTRKIVTGTAHFFRREWGATKLANLTNAAGVGRNEAAKQMNDAIVLAKRMIEQQILSADDCQVESGATPWGMRGMLSWLQPTAQSLYPVDATLLPSSDNQYTGAIASFSETYMLSMLASMHAETNAELELLGIVGRTPKTYIDDWTMTHPIASTTSTPRITWQGKNQEVFKKIVNRIETSFGTIDLLLSTFIARTTSTGATTDYSAKSAVFIDPTMWEIGWMEKPGNTNLPEDGSGKRGYVDAVLIVRCLNPLGQGRIYTST